MENEFVPYEQALALKELGFNEPCLAQYRKYDVGEATLDIGFSKNEIISKFDNLVLFCSTPLYQQAFRWFREKYKLDNFVKPNWHFVVINGYVFVINEYVSSKFKTPEEAELECLKKLIEICKNN
jgi:hypothetical protein